jgi:hypothetical protein
MNTPLKHSSIRLTVPVPIEAHGAFQDLANVLGRSLGSVIGEWLFDTRDSAQAMADQVHTMKGHSQAFTREVIALTANVQEATNDALNRARKGPGGVAGAGRGPHAVGRVPGSGEGTRKPLTPPSSNTGGKVHAIAKKTTKKGNP